MKLNFLTIGIGLKKKATKIYYFLEDRLYSANFVVLKIDVELDVPEGALLLLHKLVLREKAAMCKFK